MSENFWAVGVWDEVVAACAADSKQDVEQSARLLGIIITVGNEVGEVRRIGLRRYAQILIRQRFQNFLSFSAGELLFQIG